MDVAPAKVCTAELQYPRLWQSNLFRPHRTLRFLLKSHQLKVSSDVFLATNRPRYFPCSSEAQLATSVEESLLLFGSSRPYSLLR